MATAMVSGCGVVLAFSDWRLLVMRIGAEIGLDLFPSGFYCTGLRGEAASLLGIEETCAFGCLPGKAGNRARERCCCPVGCHPRRGSAFALLLPLPAIPYDKDKALADLGEGFETESARERRGQPGFELGGGTETEGVARVSRKQQKNTWTTH